MIMELLDIHSHRVPGATSQAIINIRFLKEEFLPKEGQYYSIGIHPWDVALKEQIDWDLFDRLAAHPQVVAIGECGIDKCVHKELLLDQETIFSRQLRVAGRLYKPILIHNVRSSGLIISIKDCIASSTPWIQHGFRGKAAQAVQLVSSGFYLSFGALYNEEALRIVPLDKLFFETDDCDIDIHEIYKKAACALEMPVGELVGRVQCNIKKVFFNE